jgi:hypothetical protein
MTTYNELLKVPKTLKQVTLWVHPEGRDIGSIFLRQHSINHAGSEQPLEALNRSDAFIAVQRENPDEMRFYNRKSIIRVEYEGKDKQIATAIKPLPCHLHMMDGSLISGLIEEPLHPNQARLLDYLNKPEDNFIKMSVDGNTLLINKSYIIHVHVENLEDSDD